MPRPNSMPHATAAKTKCFIFAARNHECSLNAKPLLFGGVSAGGSAWAFSRPAKADVLLPDRPGHPVHVDYVPSKRFS